MMYNPLMPSWMAHLNMTFETPNDGGGGEGDTANEGGAGDPKDGEGAGDTPGGTPDPVLGAQTGDDADDKGASDDGEPKDGADGEKPDDAVEDVVPEGDAGYEFTMPEGVELDQGLADAMTPTLKELGIGAVSANKLATALMEVRAAEAKAAVDGYVEKVQGWTDSAKADKEIGGDNWGAVTAAANNALQEFGTAELTAALGETGMSNHPEMIRFMNRVAIATGNDKLDRGDDVDTSDVPTEQGWYGKTTPDKKGG